MSQSRKGSHSSKGLFSNRMPEVDKSLSLALRTREDMEEAREKPLDWGLIKRLWGLTHAHKSKRNWLVFLVLLRSMQLPLLPWAIGAAISGPITLQSAEGLWWAALVFIGLAGFTDFTFHFRQRLGLELGEAVMHDLRGLIFRHLLRMPMSFFHRTKVGRLISRFTSDVESVRVGVQDVLFVGTVQVGQMLMAGALMLWCDWQLFLVVLGLAPILMALNSHFRERMSIATRGAQESFSRITATLAESVMGIRVTQGFVREDVNAGLFRALLADHSKYNLNAAAASGLLVPLLELNSQFFISCLLMLGGWQVLHAGHPTPVGNIIQFFFLANLFFAPIQMLAVQYNQALTAMAGAERIFNLLDTPPSWRDAPGARDLPRVSGRVEFRGVTFAYDPGLPVLHAIDFIAEPGQTVALVGHTGSGKSSIINLVAKFYLPTQGAVLVDGIDLREVASDSLHRQMGIVLQQSFLFSGTIMENIRMGRPNATDAEVARAAEQLDCLDLLESLPAGLNEIVGERGSGISLGQRQLVCFARAMLADPRILILDEATSSIDTITEARMQRALDILLKGRTSFVVAHRLSTIRNAGQVLVLDHGRIVERGTHDALRNENGVYAELYRQFSMSHQAT